MEPSLSYPANPLNRRIEVQNFFGTVKYFGPLQHVAPTDLLPVQLWLGIEWDDPTRGKHNGTVENFQYFTTLGNKTSGSLVKVEKVNFGIDLLDGLLMKYFKEDPKILKNQLMEGLVEAKILEKAIENKEINNQELKEINEKPIEINEKMNEITEISEIKIHEKSNNIHEKFIENKEINENNKEIPSKQPIEEEKKSNDQPRLAATVEYDDEVFFETVRKHKKKVEFVGFDKIWKKINNLKEIKEVSLQELKIGEICSKPGILRHILPNLQILALEKNLLFDYQQILHIGLEFPLLQSLSISNNQLNVPGMDLRELKELEIFSVFEQNEKIKDFNPTGCFKNLKTLILLDMDLTWLILNKILGIFSNLEELILCRNKLNDFENLTLEMLETLPNLKFLNIEENEIAHFDGLLKFKNLQHLERLTLSKNYLQDIGKISGFDALLHLSIESNLFEESEILCELAQFKNLNTLRIKNNPIIAKLGASYVRQRAVAENGNLNTINGSLLKKYERKDCEIFYLRKTFEEFFKATNTQYYEYNLDDFLTNYCKKHPRIPYLIKTYGNPYEMDPNKEKNTNNEPVKQNNMMLILKITALTGPCLGKEPIKKKFPETTTIVNLKAVLQKLLTVPVEKMIVYYKAPEKGQDPMEVLEEDLKNLMFYSVCNGGELIVDEKS